MNAAGIRQGGLSPVGSTPQRQQGDETGGAMKAAGSRPPLNCPSWARTRTLLIQSQACCQLHQGAAFWKASVVMERRGIEPLTSALRTQRSPS
jgi:hypothetical protein